MAYCDIDFKTKKALKEAVSSGQRIGCHQAGLGPNLLGFTGDVTLEGPHYPKPHTWYATVSLQDGIIVKVK